MKVLIFDFWGTLVENGVRSPIKQVRNILRIFMPFSNYVIRMEKAMMTSSFDNLKDAFAAVCNEFELNCNEYILEKLVGMWNSSWMLAEPYTEVEEVLTKLKEKYRLVLISNTDSISVARVLEKFNLALFFEKIFLSCELGMIKTDPQFLEKVIQDLNVKKEDCILIGDSMQSDIQAANNANISSILVDRRNTREFDTKITSLNQLDALLS